MLKEEILEEDERLDDLQIKGFKLIQKPSWFCFGIDAVLLSDFMRLDENDVAVEFGTGNGIVSVLAAAKYDFAKIMAFELQPEVAELARRNVALNKLKDKIEIFDLDISVLTNVSEENLIPMGSVDVVFCNPPYVKRGSGIKNNLSKKALSRHESSCGIEEFILAASRILRDGGEMYLVHRPDRLVDIFAAARMYQLEPKELKMVHPESGKPANIALIKLVKGAGKELRLLDPVYVYEDSVVSLSEIENGSGDAEGFEPNAGQLVLCPTPIGNLDDMSKSMIIALERADIIFAEDTRRTLKLLNHLGLKRMIKSYHEHNKKSVTPEIIGRLLSGKNIVLTTDAGMPGISDPGVDLVRVCIEQGISYNVLAGPTAFSIAVVASGFDSSRFCFEGFLPKKKVNKRARLSQIVQDDRSHVFYESPHALVGTLKIMFEVLGDREAFIGRELTKMYQEYRHGSISELVRYYEENKPRGEIVVVIQGAKIKPTEYSEGSIRKMLFNLIENGISRKEAVAMVVARTGVKKNFVYKLSLEITES